MSKQPASSISVSFDTSGKADDLHLELDSEKILQVYGESKTTFAPGEAAYFKLIRSSSEAYTLYSSMGSLTRAASQIAYDVSENIIFELTRYASLSHFPRENVTWQWLGTNAGIPVFNGRMAKISQAAVAVLKCSYQSTGDRLKLIVTSNNMGDLAEAEVAVVVLQGTKKVSATVTYTDEAGEGDPVPLDLSVKDFCSGESVGEVEVFLDGSSIGFTNANGRIYLGMLSPGSVHQLKMTRAGYIDSDLDVLHNDSFTVPSG